MATARGKAGAGSPSSPKDELKGMIREAVEEVTGQRERESRSRTETREQQWLRQAIREEVGGFFEDFLKGLDEGKANEGEPEGEGAAGEGFFERLLRS